MKKTNKLADLPIYVVSLNTPQHQIRRKFMQKQMDEHGLAFEFLDATDDRRPLTAEELELIGGEKMLFEYATYLTQGAVGCIVSHMRCYQKLLESPHPYCLILEDDSPVSSDALMVLQYLLNMPKKWNLIRLGYSSEHNWHPFFFKRAFPLNVFCRRLDMGGLKEAKPYYLGPYVFALYCTHGYLVSREGAEFALKNYKGVNAPLDFIMSMVDMPHQLAVSPPPLGETQQPVGERATGEIIFTPRGVKLPAHLEAECKAREEGVVAPLPLRRKLKQRYQGMFYIYKSIRDIYHQILATYDVCFRASPNKRTLRILTRGPRV